LLLLLLLLFLHVLLFVIIITIMCVDYIVTLAWRKVTATEVLFLASSIRTDVVQFWTQTEQLTIQE